MKDNDVKTSGEIQKKYGLGKSAFHDLVLECECSDDYWGAIIRITGRTFWVHEDLWVKFLDAKASDYHQKKFGRLTRGSREVV